MDLASLRKIQTERTSRINLPAIVPLILLLIIVGSCGKREQRVVCSFRPTGNEITEGRHTEFRINTKDSSALYDIDIYVRIHSDSDTDSIPGTFRIVSPGGSKYSDTIALKLGRSHERGDFSRSGIWRDYRWSYRRGVALPERGTWYIRFDLKPGTPDIEGVAEMGLIFISR